MVAVAIAKRRPTVFLLSALSGQRWSVYAGQRLRKTRAPEKSSDLGEISAVTVRLGVG